MSGRRPSYCIFPGRYTNRYNSEDESSGGEENADVEPTEVMDDSEESDVSSESGLDEPPKENSYSTLLKLLNTDTKSNEPARKKRKIKANEPDTNPVEVSIPTADDIEQLDEVADTEASASEDENNMDDEDLPDEDDTEGLGTGG